MIANKVWYQLALLWCGVLLVTAMAQGAGPAPQAKARLAILPLQGELETTADLLSVSLGKQPDVELVERQQIKKVLNELALGGAQAQNQLKLGEVLSADGLLFLDRLKKDNREFLSLKFVAVKPGVVIHRSEVPWPLTDPVVWSGFAGEQYAALMPKLFVRKEDAIPVSLLTLHSSVITPETILLDRQLTDLLGRNLMAQPKIFVLERQRLERLANEKNWQTTNEPFWNGAMVVEGVINPDGMIPGELKIKARLTPHQGQPVDVVVEGKRSQLADVLNQLVAKVAEVLRTKGEKSTWDPVAESKKFAEEAKWQLRWGFAPEAQQAAESAWALGLRSPEMSTLRIEVYAKFLIDSFSVLRNGVPDNKVTEEQVFCCRRALENYLEQTGYLKEGEINPEWLRLGENLLKLASIHLDHAKLAGERDKLDREGLRPVREKLRELVNIIEHSSPISEQSRLAEGKIPDLSNYGFILMNYGGLWGEKYADGLKHIERGAKAGFYLQLLNNESIISHAATRPAAELRCTSWCEENPLVCGEQWLAMLARLQNDTNKLARLSGYLMELNNAENDYQYEDAFLRTWKFLRENSELLIVGELPIEAARWLLRPPSNIPLDSFMENRITNELKPAFKKDCDQWMTAKLAVEQQQKWRVEEEKFIALVARLEQLTLEKKDTPPNEFFSLGVTLDLDRADRLLTAVMAYERAVPLSPVGFILRTKIQPVYLKAGKLMPPRISPNLPSSVSKSVPVKAAKIPSPATPIGLENPTIRTLDLSDVPRAPKEFGTPMLELTMPEPVTVSPGLPSVANPDELGWNQWKLMDGKLWVEMWRDVSEYYTAANEAGYKHYTFRLLYELDLGVPRVPLLHFSVKGDKDYLWVHKQSMRSMGGEPLNGDLSTFVRHQGRLYRMDQGKLWVETSMGQWQPANWNLPDSTKLTVVNDRLFANTAESLLELLPTTGEMKVLASSRNKPARTMLDALPNLTQALLFSGPQQTIRAAIGNTVYQMSSDGREWRQITDYSQNSVRRKVSQTGLLFQEGDWGRGFSFSALLPYDQAPTSLLPPIGRPPHPGPRPPNNVALWRWSADDKKVPIAGTLDGRDLWLLHEPLYFDKTVKSVIDGSYRLSWHVTGQQTAFTFILRFPPQSLVPHSIFSRAAFDLLVDERYVVLVVPGEFKAFVLSKADLKKQTGLNSSDRIKMQNDRLIFLEKRKMMWEKLYDANEDGKLDPGETALMKKNVQVQKDILELEKLKEGKH